MDLNIVRVILIHYIHRKHNLIKLVIIELEVSGLYTNVHLTFLYLVMLITQFRPKVEITHFTHPPAICHAYVSGVPAIVGNKH